MMCSNRCLAKPIIDGLMGHKNAKPKYGADRVAWAFTPVAAAYNLIRLPKLIATP